MSTTLFDHEWQFLLQIVTRVYNAESYQEACGTILQQIKTLIPYTSGIVFQAGRDGGDVKLTNPISTEALNDETDHAAFIDGDYPHWNEFVMAPYSIAFRQSDLIPADKWEKTRVYREVWQPKNHYWGLFVSLVHKDYPLAILGLLREHALGDFSQRDIYVMNTLKDPLERKIYALLEKKTRTVGAVQYSEKFVKATAQYGLTKRETEIVALSCSGKSSEEMCNHLYITHATLSKHLSNIYAKTKVRNRTQLFGLFNKTL